MAGDFLGKGVYAEGFGGVVTAGVEIEALFLSDRIEVLLELAGDEGVGSSGFDLIDHAVAASGDDADFVRIGGSEFHTGYFRSEFALEGGVEGIAIGAPFADQSEVRAFVGKKRSALRSVDGAGKAGGVADLGMGIERQVAGVDG